MSCRVFLNGPDEVLPSRGSAGPQSEAIILEYAPELFETVIRRSEYVWSDPTDVINNFVES